MLKKLVSQTAIYGLPTILGRFLNYFLVPIYVKLFLPEEYGVVSLLYSGVAFFNVLLTFGMETTYFRYASRGVSGVFSTAINFVISLSLLMVLWGWNQADSIAASPFIHIPGHENYIRWFSLILALDAISAVPLARLRHENKPMRFALIRSVNIFSNIGLNLLFLLAIPGSFEAGTFLGDLFPAEPTIAAIFIANLVSSAITFLLLLPEIRGLNEGVDFRLMKDMLAYAWPLVLVGMAGIINETIDRLLLEYFLPSDISKREQGIYSACYKLSIVMSLFIQAFRFAAEPFFFAQADTKDRGVYAKVTHYFALFCFFIFLLVSLFLDYFKHFLPNEAYWAGLDIVPILLLANLFLGVYFNLSVWYKLTDNTLLGALIALGGAALTLALNALLIPEMSYRGSAWTTLLVYVSMTIAAYFMGQRYYPVPYKVRSFGFYLIFALSLFLISQALEHSFHGMTLYGIRAALLMLFATVVYLVEKPKKILNSQH